jgi:amidohydrolase
MKEENDWAVLIRDEAEKLFGIIREIRRSIHANPELSFSEFKTSSLLKEILTANSIPFTDGWVKTGILATIQGASGGKNIALRADMDALPIQEMNQTTYASTVPGVMHACGHDVHSACVLGAGLILNNLKSKFSGSVQLLFQPGEEVLPGGARLMLEEGIFHSRQPDSVFAQHVYPSLQAGKVGFREGQYMASTDEIYITVTGKGGHGAMPHQVNDPVVAAAQIILSLQQVSSRLAPPTIPTVLSFGKVSADGATNIIPDKVMLEGTFRTMNEEWRMKAHKHIHRIASETASGFGVHADVDIRKGYPVLTNEPALTKRSRTSAAEYLGKEQVIDLDIRMTAEDFAWIAQEYPSCFYRLGTAGKAGDFQSGVHTNTFDIDEDALKTGSGLMAYLAIKELLAE